MGRTTNEKLINKRIIINELKLLDLNRESKRLKKKEKKRIRDGRGLAKAGQQTKANKRKEDLEKWKRENVEGRKQINII